MTTAASTPAETAGPSRPCNRCKDHEGTIDLRGAESVCETCFAYYVSSKAIKRLEALQRETAAPRSTKGPRRPQRYLVGLSCGPSSTALLHVLTENVRQQRARGQKTSRFEYVAVHVVDDTIPSSVKRGGGDGDDDGEGNKDPYIAAFRTRFPDANLQTVPLSSALDLPSIDWTSLPTPPTPQDPSTTPSHRLSQILHSLPSTTSRADIHRLLIRHVLVAASSTRSCDALLLGHSTTSLAELTLSETAKGRGFSLPWLVNDGAVPVPSSLNHGFPSNGNGNDDNNNNNNIATTNGVPTETAGHLPIYSPLRELFRKELVLYLSQASPPLISILPPREAAKINNSAGAGAANGSGGIAAVVSHRDLSIDDVLGRYFSEVEASYPSVVANVVRTTGKLLRRPVNDDHSHDYEGNITNSNANNGRTNCGLCGALVDELGDERWRGEIGDDEDGNGDRAETRRKLCYGCQRSIRG
ncbi:Cytoplasmic tRNA 2-thiolation protein 2 [Daldinia childiae]|uniref:Cytoplasmic tRNA 2-thiolation protein 2 n=1 Tax=Daldinia childiae TaxID=326645 RepID=UPI001445A2AE|nr:Cytoplasmic tRNA 2-thiolation protein 2 [Daldinia childiae]KAF3059619.1 Cytoplasmic tRNA 2-thiolation protein 2 [Daldinia childiae]